MKIHKSASSLVAYIMTLALIFASLGFTQTAFAADKKDKSAKRAQMMIQKMKQDMEAEKAAMQAQFDTQKKELEGKLKAQDEAMQVLDKKLAKSESKVRSLTAELKKTNDEKTALDEKLTKTQAELDTTQKNLAELQSQYKQAQADLKFNDGQRKTLSSNLANTTKSLTSCEEKNDKLYGYGKDLIQIYDSPSRYEEVMRKEQFLQLKRVELENILQSKLDKLDEAHITSRNVGP